MAQIKYTRKQVVQVAEETTAGELATTGYRAVIVNSGGDTAKKSTTVTEDVVSQEFGDGQSIATASMFDVKYGFSLKSFGKDGGGIPNPTDWQKFIKASSCVETAGYVCTKSTGTGTFVVGEIIKVAAATVGVLVDIDGTTLFIRGTGTLINADEITGDDSAATATVSAVKHAVFFEPTSDADAMTSLSLKVNEDGILKTATGVKGNSVITCAPKAVPKIDFTGQGLYTNPTDTALPAVVTEKAALQAFQGVHLVFGDLAVNQVFLGEITLDFGCEVKVPDDAQASSAIGGIFITNAKPKLSITMTKPPISVFNAYLEHETSTTRNFAAQWGATDKTIRIGARVVQFDQLSESDKDGIKNYKVDLKLPFGNPTPLFYIAQY
jgi:hypothetical protein